MSLLLYTNKLNPNEFRVWRSPLGQTGTWTQLDTQTDSTSAWASRLFSPSPGHALAGQVGPLAISAFERTPLHVVTRSIDTGTTWHTAVPEDVLSPVDNVPTYTWEVTEFLDLGNNIVLALGTFTDDGSNTLFGFLKSTDGGATFAKFKPSPFDNETTVCGLSLGNGVALVRRRNTTGNFVYKTTDYGETWTQKTVPTIPGSTTPQILDFIQLTTGRIVGIGDRNVATVRRPSLWYSDDEGETWTAEGNPVPSFAAGAACRPAAALALPNGYALVACPCDPVGTSATPFWLSADGITYDLEGTYADSFTAENGGSTLQMALADDGAIIALFCGELAGNGVAEVWRGVQSGNAIAWARTFEADSGAAVSGGPCPGTCVRGFVANIGELPTPSVSATLPGDCPPLPFAPEPCPQECPTPTTPTLATLPTPLGPQAGFAAPLFWLGLMLGGAPSAMGRPEGCGPFFFPDTQTQECA